MSFLLTLTLFISFRGATFSSAAISSISSPSSSDRQSSASDCGVRPVRRQPRNAKTSNTQEFFYNDRIPKIISGTPTREGHFPWQASLELLHPSMGFLGHWCGGVLIDRYWILSAAHCVHNDLFNLPLPPLWTVVLGEYDRTIESGYEQRIPVEKIVLHRSYHNFRHDLVLMKLSVPADLTYNSNIRKICLPFIYDEHTQSSSEQQPSSSSILSSLSLPLDDYEYLEKDNNFLRKIRSRNSTKLPSMKELLETKIIERLRKSSTFSRIKTQTPRTTTKSIKYERLYVPRRRNDKLMADFTDYLTTIDPLTQAKHASQQDYQDLPYIDCVATGWGKFNLSGDLTDILLKTNVPLHNSARCRSAYGSFVKIHKGHLCAGKLNGKGGTCVGDSGGPLQCRLTKNGPWILAGVTSFGSGCALEGFPDVYTRTSYYMKWIFDTINSDG